MDAGVIHSRQRFSFDRIAHMLVGVLLVLGLVFSIMSAFHICSTACAEGHKYRMFGFHFETFGIAFFIFALLCYFLAFHWPNLMQLVKLSVAGALGAELYFLYVQKYIIGQWCPLCITIAATVALIGVIFSIQYFRTLKNGSDEESRRSNNMMTNLVSALASLSMGLIGFAVALLGIAKEERSFADNNARGENPVFGNPKSTVEVYYFSDWFCPACRKTEPELEKQLPSIMTKARVFFIDVPIHEDSLNFLPYNLSFMLKQKGEYVKLRKALADLAQKNGTPSESDVEALAKRFGVTYQQLDFAEVNQGLKYFKKMTDKYSVDSTPTLVITNPKTKKAKKLSGYKQITQANIPHIIEQLK